MGGGGSKQSEGMKKFKNMKAVTAGEFQLGVNEKSTTVGGSKKLHLVVGTVRPLSSNGETETRIKISPFGRKKAVALTCTIGKKGTDFSSASTSVNIAGARVVASFSTAFQQVIGATLVLLGKGRSQKIGHYTLLSHVGWKWRVGGQVADTQRSL